MNTLTTSASLVPAPAAAKSKNQRVVVVLGMHRSGTSLLTNLLTVLGVELGTNLLPANEGNEAGYWENESIYRTQDALMNFLARNWGEYGFAYPFPIDWNRLPEMREFQERLTSIVRTEIAAAKGIWGFKDPRTCRLLPLWKRIFAELNLEPLYVLAIRDPAVVVSSLLKLYPLDALHGELVWLLYNLDAIRDAGEELRIVVDYDRWFTDPVAQAKAVAGALELAWPSQDNDLVAQLTQRIRPDLRHSKTSRPCSLPFVDKTHAMLQQAAATGHAPDKTVSAYLSHAAAGLAAVLEISSESGQIIVAVGHAELLAGNFEAAEAAFTRAARLQPKLADAHSGLALALLSRGRWTEAAESLKQAIALDATDAVALRVWAKIHLHRGQIEDAENICQLLLQKNAGDPQTLQVLKETQEHKERTKRAADQLFAFGAPVSPPRIAPAPFRARKNGTTPGIPTVLA